MQQASEAATIISPVTSGTLWKQWRLTRREENRPGSLQNPPVADSLTVWLHSWNSSSL